MATNKERLDTNNDKIETIIKTLKNKMLSAGGGSNLVWTLLEDGSYKLEITNPSEA